MDTVTLKIYGDYASQPSRAVLAFCKLNNIPYDFQEVRVGKREHMADEYVQKVNPAMIVPAIIEVDKKTGEEFKLFESHAILRYLARSRKVADHWYPQDLDKRSQVDIYLDWHHTFLRQAIGFHIYKRFFAPIVHGIKSTDDELKFYAVWMKRTLDLMERRLTESKYLCGDEISIADLSAVCELIQGKFLNLDFAKWPKLKEWQDKLIYGNPDMHELHKPMFKFAELSMKKHGQPKL